MQWETAKEAKRLEEKPVDEATTAIGACSPLSDMVMEPGSSGIPSRPFVFFAVQWRDGGGLKLPVRRKRSVAAITVSSFIIKG